MKYLAAFCLAALGGSQNPGNDVKGILESVGCAIDEAQLKTVLDNLNSHLGGEGGKALHELISSGMSKVQTVSFGGSGGGAGGAGGAGAGGAGAEVEEEKVEEKPKVEAVKVSLGGGGGLFGGDSSSDDDDSSDEDSDES